MLVQIHGDGCKEVRITEKLLDSVVDGSLKRFGIKVVRGEEWKKIPGMPFIHLTIDTIRHEEIYAGSISLKLNQQMKFHRDPKLKVIPATTLHKTHLFLCGKDKLRDTIEKGVVEEIKMFIEIFLEQNKQDEK